MAVRSPLLRPQSLDLVLNRALRGKADEMTRSGPPFSRRQNLGIFEVPDRRCSVLLCNRHLRNFATSQPRLPLSTPIDVLQSGLGKRTNNHTLSKVVLPQSKVVLPHAC